jgi:pentatricopeptide repeat protein
MYSKCGVIEMVENVFDSMRERNSSSWNGMLSAYVENEEEEKAVGLYHKMKQQQSELLNDSTFTSILRVSRSLELCKMIHFDAVSAGCEQTLSVAASLVHAYGSCASMEDGQAVFDELREADLVLWNACIDGHAGEGQFISCLHVFQCFLLHAGTLLPDEVSLTSILSVCSHTGHVSEALEFFEHMMGDGGGFDPNLKHYGILLDLLGRAGDFTRVESLLSTMPMPMNLAMWSSLLGACSVHGNVELAKQAFESAVRLQPKQTTAYIVMSNISIDAGLLDDAA